MNQSQLTPEQWGAAYEAERRNHVAFTTALKALLQQLLNEEEIPYVQIESRTKEVPNFVSKLKRKNEKYRDPLAEVTDLVGLRIVLYYLDDVEKVSELIERQFAVDQDHSVDKKGALDPDRFGYLSVHHVVRLPASRRDLLEWKRFQRFCAEIQVRTVLQHAWAAISRKLAYASLREAPRDLQRNLNRLSALLELADDEFVDIRKAKEAIEKKYDRELERGNLDLEVDESSLDIYLRESGRAEDISALAREAGSPTAAEKAAGYDELGIDGLSGDFRDLLVGLQHGGFERIADVDEMLSRVWEALPDFMAEVNQRYGLDDDGRPLSDDPHNWLTLIALWSIGAPAGRYEDLGYVKPLIEIVTSLPRPD